MSNSAANVTAGKPAVAGSIYTALTSANPTIPTTADAALSGFDLLGYISEDGVTRAQEISSEAIKAWGGDTVLYTRTGKDTSFTFKMLEYLSDIVQKVIYGASNVSGSLATGLSISDKASFAGEDRAWIIEMVMTGDVKCRIVIPHGIITSIGEIKYADAEAAGYEITIGATPDSSGVTVHEYLKKPASGNSGDSGNSGNS